MQGKFTLDINLLNTLLKALKLINVKLVFSLSLASISILITEL